MSQATHAIRPCVERFNAPLPSMSAWCVHRPSRLPRTRPRFSRLKSLVAPILVNLGKLRKLVEPAMPTIKKVAFDGLEVIVFGITLAAAMGSLWLLGT